MNLLMTTNRWNNQIAAVCRAVSVCMLLLTFTTSAWCQLRVMPLKHDHTKSKKTFSQGRTKEVVPLTLPFFDDFSQPSISKVSALTYPNSKLWDDGNDVSVNNGLGINPPT